jgi:hypothetical protein
LPTLSTVTAANSESERLQIPLLGKTEGVPVTNGFVFVDGKYLDIPYVVSRRGLGLFINDQLVEDFVGSLSRPQAPPRKIKSDPIRPSSISKETSRYDKVLLEYLGQKQQYLLQDHDEKTVVRLMADCYADLPCVSKVELTDNPNAIMITWASGQSVRTHIFPPTRKPIEGKPAELAKELEQIRASYEERLKLGDFYILGEGGRITGTAAGAKGLLPVLVPALRSAKTSAAVYQTLKAAGIDSVPETHCEGLFKNFSPSPQLDERVQNLMKPDGENRKQNP